MRYLYKTIYRLLVIMLVACVVVACDSDDNLGTPDRLFRPQLSPSQIGETWFSVIWDKYKDTEYYEVDLSVDTFKTVMKTLHTDSSRMTVQGLDYDTDYQLRIRAVGNKVLVNGDTIRSAYQLYSVKTSDYPTLLSNPTSTDVIDKSVRVKWTISPTTTYDRIDVMLDKAQVFRSVVVTDADNAAGMKIISGLLPSTSYIVKAYSNDQYKGKKTYITAASQIFVGDVVDLRDMNDDEALKTITQAFVDSVATLYSNGFNLVLSGGTNYEIPTLNIPVSMNIVTGLSFKGKAVLNVNGSFGLKASTTIPKIKFEKIFFSEGNVAGKLKTDGNYGGTYLFNLNQSGGNVDSLILENCDIKYKRGAIRMQTTASITKLVINNCLIDSIGGYGVINNGNDASYIGDIFVTNSSFFHCEKFMVGGKALGINSLTLDKVTTCYTPTLAANYFFDYNNNTIPGGITITNSLFGVGGATSVNGMRSKTSSVTIQNSYRTSDLTWTLNATTLVPNAPIDDFENLGKTAVEIFENPAANNFKVSLSLLVNKVGDPRWW